MEIMTSLLTAALLMAAEISAPEAPAQAPTVISLEQAIEIALSENVAVKVADKEIERSEYAKKGTYASLFPSIDASGAFQRTIEKQVMYMDGGGFDFGSMIGESLAAYLAPLYMLHGISLPTPDPGETPEEEEKPAEGFSVGRWNTWSTGISASMPLVNAQLWESIKLSGKDVELAVEKARSSRLEMVTQVKQAYYAVLMAKQANAVYRDVYNNAVANFNLTQMKYDAHKASDLQLARAATTLANAIPNLYDSDNAIVLALWQLKAVMGVDLEENIDIQGSLLDYADSMTALFSDEELSLDRNSTMRQLAIQAEQLAGAVRAQEYAFLPSLAVAFTYNFSAMANDFKFSTYNWTPYSYVGLSLSIPIFSGGRRLNNVRSAKVQQQEFELQRTNAERQLKIGIRQALGTMETSIRSFDAAKKASEAAQKAYDITSESYAIGGATITDLNDAQLALVQSKLAVSQGIYSYLSAKASLEQTLGMDYISENAE